MLGVGVLFFTKGVLAPSSPAFAAVRKLSMRQRSVPSHAGDRRGVFESILSYDCCLYQHRL